MAIDYGVGDLLETRFGWHGPDEKCLSGLVIGREKVDHVQRSCLLLIIRRRTIACWIASMPLELFFTVNIAIECSGRALGEVEMDICGRDHADDCHVRHKRSGIKAHL